MRKQFKDVEEFQRKYGYRAADMPGHPDIDTRRFRVRLIQEEAKELMDEIAKPNANLEDVLGECIDLIYVVLGTLVAYGINPVKAWKLIHRANMKKIAVKGDKPLKPKGWKKANLKPDLAKQMMRRTKIRWRPVWGFSAWAPSTHVSMVSWGVHIGPLEVIRRK